MSVYSMMGHVNALQAVFGHRARVAVQSSCHDQKSLSITSRGIPLTDRAPSSSVLGRFVLTKARGRGVS